MGSTAMEALLGSNKRISKERGQWKEVIIKQKNYKTIITIPPAIIEKIEKFGKSFDQLSLSTVKGFLKDSKKSNFKI